MKAQIYRPYRTVMGAIFDPRKKYSVTSHSETHAELLHTHTMEVAVFHRSECRGVRWHRAARRNLFVAQISAEASK